MSNNCRFLHDWGQWKDAKSGDLNPRKDDRESVIGWIIYQKRICNRCGFTEINIKSVYL